MEELKKLFTEDAILEGGYDDNYFTWMLFVDGCSALYFMKNVDMHHPEALNTKLDQLMYISRDMSLLENQLPMRLFKLLLESGKDNLDYLLVNFQTMGAIKELSMAMILLFNYDAIHILDHFRSLLIRGSMEENTIPNQDDDVENVIQNTSSYQLSIYTFKNIRDLKAVGIGVKHCTTGENPVSWNNVHFSSNWLGGELKLPMLMFDDNTPYTFQNLLAYEMYVNEPRLSGVFENLLGSDEDLANLFNELGDDLPNKVYCHIIHIDVVRHPRVGTRAEPRDTLSVTLGSTPVPNRGIFKYHSRVGTQAEPRNTQHHPRFGINTKPREASTSPSTQQWCRAKECCKHHSRWNTPRPNPGMNNIASPFPPDVFAAFETSGFELLSASKRIATSSTPLSTSPPLQCLQARRRLNASELVATATS
ncbi:hypothetical protein Fmac_023235 [Flemingia macrophylla]|uniref:Uncharacterized protein n=1 Tax=Flemingia macrophylla TaxID=520843 RepID=A0ABD1LKW9_9FABA